MLTIVLGLYRLLNNCKFRNWKFRIEIDIEEGLPQKLKKRDLKFFPINPSHSSAAQSHSVWRDPSSIHHLLWNYRLIARPNQLRDRTTAGRSKYILLAKCTEMHKGNWAKCIQMHLNASKCIQMHPNTPKCIQMHPNAPKCTGRVKAPGGQTLTRIGCWGYFDG